MNRIWVFCEQRDNVLQPVALELMGAARSLAAQSEGTVGALLLGSGVSPLAQELIACGADTVYVVDDEKLAHYTTEAYAQAICQMVREENPASLLFGATSIGRDLAPRISARLRTGLTADCTKLEIDEQGSLFMTRPAFGGNLFATIICPNSRPQMSTVRPGVMPKPVRDDSRQGEIVPVTVAWQTEKLCVRVVEETKESQSVENIEEAKLLVSCGRGVKNTEPAFELAKKMKGTVSSSRALVDAGIMEQPRQVGQTGKTVRPQAYLAFGISGAIQHLAGMEESEYIVAINTDKNAPIFKIANLGIVADAAAVMKELNKLLEEA
ncbi:MAG: electron transfer flavoprotein subunit alpha/FixB family protein [Oscillospiraceae bacterium]|jgi:electron transfer flavoprotein alpha subunit|nr:electron transfer flavoprotein subunit alpha/FixB family protein [Oscillospiraceae bacterium]